MAKGEINSSFITGVRRKNRMPNTEKSSGEDYVKEVEKFFIRKGISSQLDETQKSRDFYSFLFRSLLKVNYVRRGGVSCRFSVSPPFINIFNGLHGGVIGGISERVAVACVRTVVAANKDLFLGELSISYLSSAPLNEVCTVEEKIVRSGRNLSVVATEFRLKSTKKVIYTARATFYHMPIAKL